MGICVGGNLYTYELRLSLARIANFIILMVEIILAGKIKQDFLKFIKCIALILIGFLFFGSAVLGQGQSFTPKQLEEKITARLLETQRTLIWEEEDERTVYSALIHSDSVAAIGYQPAGFLGLRSKMHTIDLSEESWSTSRDQLIDYIVERTNELNEGNYNRNDLLVFAPSKKTPNFYIKIWNPEIVEELRNLPEIRYLHPTGYTINSTEIRSGEGCSDYSSTLDAADYNSITPTAIQSWHHFEHNIDAAWTKCDQGEDIWIALMDTGVSDDNPKFNAEWSEGQSAGRVIEKNDFYINDGWDDKCGHGTAMGGLIAAPRGTSDSPAGAAYRANMISYRVTNDVRINTTDEINGLGTALTDAGDDARVDIISVSLGDIFTSGPVEDGVIYAHNLGKLIFAAAGTSTTFLNWYGVIFPANMPETVAVTGAIEGTNFTRCANCHDGNEVDFVVYMERGSGNNAITTTDDNTAGSYRGYVGGSSAATATMAGVAAMVWDNNPTYNKDQIINRLIQTSSNYPDRDSDFGWGAVDASLAVDTTFNIPCSAAIGNQVNMEILNITFPPIGDTGSEAEWVLTFGSQSFYFEVPVGGATGNPQSFINQAICGSIIPINIDLGESTCGQDLLPLFVESYEDDSVVSNCSFNTGLLINDDDHLFSETLDVSLGANSFTHTSSAGTFTIEYILYCQPLLVAGIVDDSPACPGDDINFVATPSGETNYEFFLDINADGMLDSGESLQSGPSTTYVNNSLMNGDIIGLLVTDANGCTNISTTTVYISPTNYSGANALTGIESGIADYETDGVIESTQIIQATAIVDYDSGIEVNLLPGFQTNNGCEFMAFIDGCNGGAGGLNLDDNGGTSKIEIEEAPGDKK